MSFSRVAGFSEAPNWQSLTTFKTESTTLDKVSRVINNISFVGSLYGIYALSRNPGIITSCASYVSIGLAARKMIATTIGYLVYPAALTSLPCCGGDRIEKEGNQQINDLRNDGFIVRKISLNKSGTRYDAIVIAHLNTMENGNWTINALGNGMVMEYFIEGLARENFTNQCNTLLINGPSVGSSTGWPTRYQMGAGFEAGLKFLERETKATHIVMHGLSLGGGMMAEAILNHDFSEARKQGICYLSISDRTFSRLSTIAGELVGRIVKPIFYMMGMELDGIGAAKKLTQLGIQQIIIQHSSIDSDESDSVIPDHVSLARELRSKNILGRKTFLESRLISHNGPLPNQIQESLKGHIKKFIENHLEC